MLKTAKARRARLRVLFLDDDQRRHLAFEARFPKAVRLWSALAALAAIKRERWACVHLDHDLGGLGPSGLYNALAHDGTWLAKEIADLPEDQRPAKVVVHSRNAPAARRMADILEAAGCGVKLAPFELRQAGLGRAVSRTAAIGSAP